MNKLFVCAVALGLLASAPVSAQKNDHNGDKRNAATSHGDRGPSSSGTQQNNRGSANTGQNGRSRATAGNTPAKPAWTGNARPIQHSPAVDTSAKRFLPNSGDVHPNAQVRSTADRARNNSGWSDQAARQRPDIGAMRRNMQASRHFRGGSYNAPRGYQQRHWGYGERLPRSYFVSSYWIANFMMFDLFAPPSYLVWVRVGSDALLIDRDTGEIVQVRYGVFY